MKLTTILFLLLTSMVGISQSLAELRDDIAFFGDIVMNTAASDHRIRANDSLNRAVDRFLQFPSSFDEQVVEFPWISVQTDADKTFRLLTWQLNVGDSSYASYGRIQMKSNDFIELRDQKNQIEPRFRTLDVDSWLGARYYNMKEFEYKGQPVYLLFGYDGHSRWNRQKIADILYFENGEAKFGLPVFTEEGKDADRYGSYRIILKYSLDSRVTLDFDETMDMIVHDHLISVQGRFEGQGETSISDGSFEGYRLNKKGVWVYQEKLFKETSDEPLDSGIDRTEAKKKDLFGRDRQ
jgi:hypothetical protein